MHRGKAGKPIRLQSPGKHRGIPGELLWKMRGIAALAKSKGSRRFIFLVEPVVIVGPAQGVREYRPPSECLPGGVLLLGEAARRGTGACR